MKRETCSDWNSVHLYVCMTPKYIYILVQTPKWRTICVAQIQKISKLKNINFTFYHFAIKKIKNFLLNINNLNCNMHRCISHRVLKINYLHMFICTYTYVQLHHCWKFVLLPHIKIIICYAMLIYTSATFFSRFGAPSAPLERGQVSPGTYCTRNYEECYRKPCRLQSPNYPGMYPRYAYIHTLLLQHITRDIFLLNHFFACRVCYQFYCRI